MTEPLPVEWLRPAALPADGLHVWRIGLARSPPPTDGTPLPGDEAARARRLIDPAARARFLALRQATRAILARYVDAPPAALRFGSEPRGKPLVVEPATDWQFNLTDSRELALLAISRAGPVGIDLEYLRPLARRDGIARRMLGEATVASLQEVPPELRDLLFFRHWTAFEARQKATGAGLSGPRAEPADWPVRHFVPAPGCIAALAHAANPGLDIHFFGYAE